MRPEADDSMRSARMLGEMAAWRLSGILAVASAAGALLLACGSGVGDTNGNGAGDAGGSQPSDASGPSADGSSPADAGGGDAKSAVASFGPDVCGDGLDNDGNGIVDDGCTVPACSLKVLHQFEVPIAVLNDAAYDHARHLILFWGFPPQQGGAASSLSFWGEDGQQHPEHFDLIPDLRGRAFAVPGGFIAWSGSKAPPTSYDAFRLDPSLALVGAATPLPVTAAANEEPWLVAASAGRLWAAQRVASSTDFLVRSIDAKTLVASPRPTVSFGSGAVPAGTAGVLESGVFDLGGVPVLGSWAGSHDSSGSGIELRTSIARIDGTSWAITGLVDDWQMGAAQNPLPLLSRSDSNILACLSFLKATPSSMFFQHFGCHRLDVATGSNGGFDVDYPTTDYVDRLGLDWGADGGWLVARVLRPVGAAPTTQTVRIDRISATGVLTPAVLETTVPLLDNGSVSLRTVAPNVHILITPKQVAGQPDGTAYVTVLGC
jgi:hypothetical protein